MQNIMQPSTAVFCITNADVESVRCCYHGQLRVSYKRFVDPGASSFGRICSCLVWVWPAGENHANWIFSTISL